MDELYVELSVKDGMEHACVYRGPRKQYEYAHYYTELGSKWFAGPCKQVPKFELRDGKVFLDGEKKEARVEDKDKAARVLYEASQHRMAKQAFDVGVSVESFFDERDRRRVFLFSKYCFKVPNSDKSNCDMKAVRLYFKMFLDSMGIDESYCEYGGHPNEPCDLTTEGRRILLRAEKLDEATCPEELKPYLRMSREDEKRLEVERQNEIRRIKMEALCTEEVVESVCEEIAQGMRDGTQIVDIDVKTFVDAAPEDEGSQRALRGALGKKLAEPLKQIDVTVLPGRDAGTLQFVFRDRGSKRIAL